ncbi:hypothetical protein ACFOVU_19685 [Nocardiopsis sediminis]|uniref:Uncharacterized protein n=1 Tax=Nocardiopsis sediminis TaxID=1778267 RepID=A0ABV8FT22_9ACTN
MGDQPTRPTPPRIRNALLVLVIQVVYSVAVGLLILADIAVRIDHHQEVGLVPGVLIGISVILAAALALCAVFMRKRFDDARSAVFLVESLAIPAGLAVLLLTGMGLGALPGLMLPIAVMFSLRGDEADQWFDR